MTTILFEDETPAVKRLTKILQECDPDIKILKVLDSVEQGILYLKEQAHPDFILMDIHLSDGNSLGIFKEVQLNCPVIFTTAYDEYALEAFKVNSVDYLLKPVKTEDLQRALQKLKSIHFKPNPSGISNLVQQTHKTYKDRFVVKLGNKLIPIEIQQIAYFFSRDKISFICDRDGKSYPIDFSLDKIEEMVDPKVFFRINRQILSAHDSIVDIQMGAKAKVQLTLSPSTSIEASVSSERSSLFKKWLKRES